ncbi:SDR family NAD(P)-dependent oxidoreductase [Bacillus sp. SCS-153A]|uniref:SDR family NAD(P)-dependent oxidoreductase n=1 Tax=Rossellomorea sedimentorum TaxID=3115294 RepID=UPI003906A8B4
MEPGPVFTGDMAGAAKRLDGKMALITGGDSSIGHAVAIAYAKEGADVAIVYLEENSDAQGTKEYIEKAGGKCFCQKQYKTPFSYIRTGASRQRRNHCK